MVTELSLPLPCSVYADDATITDEHLLVRTVHPSWVRWEPVPHLKSEAFQDYPAKRLATMDPPVPAVAMSVSLLFEIEQCNLTIECCLGGFGEEYGLATLTAGQVRACNQGIVRWPIDEKPWHAMVFCLQGAQRSTRHKKQLARAATLVRLPARPS